MNAPVAEHTGLVQAEGVRRLQRLAATVGSFWGEGLPVVVESGAPCFNWRQVRIPPKALAGDDDSLICLLLHEWGHRCIAPRTVEQALWWQLLARLEGIGASADAVNVACDLLVDQWYMRHTEWGALYLRTELASLQNRLSDSRFRNALPASPPGRFLLACYERLGGWHTEMREFVLDRELARRAMACLFDPASTLDDRVRGFLREAAPAFPGTADEGVGCRAGGPGGPMPPLLGAAYPWIGQEWDAGELVRLLAANSLSIPAAMVAEVCGTVGARELVAKLRILESLLRVQRDVERAVSSVRHQRSEGSTLWRIGEPTRELDAVLTLERAGLLIPGLTTLRRRRAPTSGPQARLPTVCLVIDNSGSTQGEILQGELDAAVALLEASRRLRVDVGAVVFGSAVHAVVEPGPRHSAVERLLASLNSQSGGTCLAPALARASRMLPTGQAPMATVIFTDSYLFDLEGSLQHLRVLNDRGPTVLFVPENYLMPGFLAGLHHGAPRTRVVRVRPGQRLVDEALAVLQ